MPYELNGKPSAGPDWVLVTMENYAALFAMRGRELSIPFEPGDWVRKASEPATRQTKFYFNHLSPAQKQKFVDMLNEHRMKLDYPGYFYTKPYFVSVNDAQNGQNSPNKGA